MMIECVCCNWQGSDSELIMPFSGSEASCPSCLGDDFIDLDDNYTKVAPMHEFLVEPIPSDFYETERK